MAVARGGGLRRGLRERARRCRRQERRRLLVRGTGGSCQVLDVQAIRCEESWARQRDTPITGDIADEQRATASIGLTLSGSYNSKPDSK